MVYLWTPSGEPPWELISYVLRRDVYHCLPSELDGEDWLGVSSDIAIRNAISKVEVRG